jgi:indolepyruvate ferredoxin oxidoreductase beta subunit
MDTFKIVVAGVGGQGTLLVTRLLADTAIRAGMHVKIGETYGMAQRGGPVMGHIQIGGKINNPQIRKGEANVLIGFEPAEAVRRGVTYLKRGGLAIINTRVTAPVEVVSGMRFYPDMEKMIKLLRKVTDDIHLFDATGIAEEAGDPITTNIVMLGAISKSGLLPYSEEAVIETLKTGLKPQFLEMNMRAFELGKKVYDSL